MSQQRVAIVSADELISQGLKTMLDYETRWQVVGLFDAFVYFERYLQHTIVPFVVLDASIARDTQELHHAISLWLRLQPTLRIVVMSPLLGLTHIDQLFELGIMAFIHRRDCKQTVLAAALEFAAENQPFISSGASIELYRRRQEAQARDLRSLDIDVLNLMYAGLRTQEIAATLLVDDRTIYRSRRRLRTALGARNSEQVIPEALRCGLLRDEGEF